MIVDHTEASAHVCQSIRGLRLLRVTRVALVLSIPLGILDSDFLSTSGAEIEVADGCAAGKMPELGVAISKNVGSSLRRAESSRWTYA